MDVWNKESGNAILTALKDAGMGIRRTDFLSIRRDVLGIIKYQEKMEKLPGPSLVPKAYMQDRSELKMSNNLQYRFTVLGYDPETDERDFFVRAISSNEWMSKDQAEEFISSIYIFPVGESNYIVEDVMLEEVWLNDEKCLI